MTQAGAQSAESRPRILVVEDEPLIRECIAETLREADLDVVEARNADQALSLVLSEQTFDLVFTDVQMPGCFDGLELARRLHDLHPSLPVILTSGAIAADELPPQFVFLPKPYRPSAATAAILAALRSPSAGDDPTTASAPS